MLTTIFTGVQFFLLILVVFTFLFWIIPQKYQWISFMITVFLFAYMAYMIVPEESDDLYLYWSFIDDMREHGWEQFLWHKSESHFDWDTYIVSGYYFYAFSLLPDANYDHLFPAVTIFIAYGLNLLTIHRASVKFNIDKIHVYLGTMFCLTTYWFFDTASGIRNGLTFSIVIACAYQQFVNHKKYILCFLGYVIALLFHSAGFIAVGLVALTMLTVKIFSKYLKYFLLFFVSSGTVVVNYLSTITESGFFKVLTSKTEHYGSGDRVANVFDLGTSLQVNILTLVLVLILYLYVSGYLKLSNYQYLYKYENLMSNTIFFLIGASSVGIVMVRFVRWVLPVFGAIIFMIGMQYQKNNIDEKGVSDVLYYSSAIERLKYKSRPIVLVLWIVFIGVYIWYACNGTSLIWAHFEHEWVEIGRDYLTWDINQWN